MARKYRDQLLSAAMQLADDPTKTLAFLEVADAVLEAIETTPPTVEELTPYQRIDRIIGKLEQLAREWDETPLATWCLRAVEDLQQGKLRQAVHEAAKESRK